MAKGKSDASRFASARPRENAHHMMPKKVSMATTVAIPLTIAITAPPRIRPWRRLRGRPRPDLADTLPVRLLRFYPLVARVLSGFVHRRSEEHTSELQSLMRISYAVFCLKTKT